MVVVTDRDDEVKQNISQQVRARGLLDESEVYPVMPVRYSV